MGAVVRVLTNQGRGAIAVLEVWGRSAVEVVDVVFRPAGGKPLGSAKPGRLLLGRAGRGLGDEVIAVRLETPVPSAEIHCHGGFAAVEAVASALEAAGARRLSGCEQPPAREADPFAAHALDDLPFAPTVRTAEILLDQVHGALGGALERLRREIIDAPHLPISSLDRLIQHAETGMRLLTGWKVAIAGRPNVGKSRLFNTLAGFDRAIVAPSPGVTRDVVTFRTALDGWPVEVADTAGLRESDDAIESSGIARSRRAHADADLVMLVLDRSEPLQQTDYQLIGEMPDALVVANKSDLAPAWDTRGTALTAASPLAVSAESGDGITELIAAIPPRLVPEPPAPGAAVPFRSDQIEALRAVRASLATGDRAAAARLLGRLGSAPAS
jgi:tRNA modification GTPase